MKKILVATDFSNCALNAMEYALELAKILKVEVCAIHAIGSTEGLDNNVFNALYIEDYYNTKRETLKEWAQTFTQKEVYKNIPVSTFSDVGSVSTVISKYIDANPVELLVMGNMGSTGIAGLFGSNTNIMVEKTKTPMVIVPLESKFSTKPIITLATDFATKLSPEDINGLNHIVEASKIEKLNVLNIIEGPEWKTNPSGEESMKQVIKSVELEFNYVIESNATEGIMKYIASKKTDILCVVKHHHNIIYRIFNKSTVNQVMNKSIKSVLVLHE